MDWIKDIDKDEERAEFLVTAKRKRIWNVEISLLKELERVCDKYHLRYMAHYGTLLGAVRHKGYIPWDDDLDIVMPRPDYQKLLEIGPTEFHAPFFLQSVYTDANFGMPIAKLRDSRTSAIQYPDFAPENMNQGIFVDIFPLDCTYDGSENSRQLMATAAEVWATVYNAPAIRQALAAGVSSYLSSATLRQLVDAPREKRMKTLDDFLLEHYEDTLYLNSFVQTVGQMGQVTYNRQWFETDPAWFPFEETEIAVPREFYKVLRKCYGPRYFQYIRHASIHEGTIFEPDIPYTEYLTTHKKN